MEEENAVSLNEVFQGKRTLAQKVNVREVAFGFNDELIPASASLRECRRCFGT